ncbi:hypothetical protein ES705_33071 [subsurface metagenome]
MKSFFSKTAERFDQGIGSTDVLWGWLATLRWFNELGKEDIQKRVVRLGGYLIARARVDSDIK